MFSDEDDSDGEYYDDHEYDPEIPLGYIVGKTRASCSHTPGTPAYTLHTPGRTDTPRFSGGEQKK